MYDLIKHIENEIIELIGIAVPKGLVELGMAKIKSR